MTAPVVQVLNSGDRNHVINVIGEADTAGGTIVDVATLAASSTGRAVASVSLSSLTFSTDKAIKVDWDADADKTFLALGAGSDSIDYRAIGGLINDAGAGVSGDVVIPAPTSASNYTITASFKKKY